MLSKMVKKMQTFDKKSQTHTKVSPETTGNPRL